MSGVENQSDSMVDDANSSTPPPKPNWRALTERVKQLEREIPRLTQQLHHLQRCLVVIMAERDRLQA